MKQHAILQIHGLSPSLSMFRSKRQRKRRSLFRSSCTTAGPAFAAAGPKSLVLAPCAARGGAGAAAIHSFQAPISPGSSVPRERPLDPPVCLEPMMGQYIFENLRGV